MRRYVVKEMVRKEDDLDLDFGLKTIFWLAIILIYRCKKKE